MKVEFIFKIYDLKKDFNKKTVLDIKQLNIPKGKINSLIGPSGAGKSTLLHILNHIEQPSRGTIEYEGCNYPDDGNLNIHIRREMAMVFQKPVVFNNSVYENIAYGLKLRKFSRITERELVEAIASTTGLKDKLKQNARTLSGGEMQRVALARALVLKPKVLFMDEATTNLDPANVIMIEELVKDSNLANKTTIIAATHNMNQAKRISSHTIFLLNGNVIESGDTKEIFEHPKNKLTEAFISGDMIC